MTDAATWAIDPAHTYIGFTVRHLGLTNTRGIFKNFHAQLRFDASDIETSSVTFEVDTDSIDTGLGVRDNHLRGEDWFDTQTHPKAVFASRTVRHVGHGKYEIAGDLSLRSFTRPICFNAVLTGYAVNPWTQADLVGFELTACISRSSYGMGAFPGALSDEVHLRVEVELSKTNDTHQKTD